MDKLNTDIFFGTPVYKINKPEFLNEAIKVTDPIIEQAIKDNQPALDKKKKFLGEEVYNKVKDHGLTYHSDQLVGKLKTLETYIGNTAHTLLDEQGYDMSLYTMFFTELWVQEFAKNGGGHHDTHTHYDNHISGFYFLKCSDKTSFPIFHDPRHGLNMARLQLKEQRATGAFGNEKINLMVKPGDLVFFNSYLPHQFVVDDGIEPFRFIHFNLQAVRNYIIKSVK